VETYAVDVNTSRTPEDDAQSPRWPNGLIIIIICIIIIIIIMAGEL
jgi:flagellar basal body-associated protein FliL